MIFYTLTKKIHVNEHVIVKTRLVDILRDDLFPLFFFFKSIILTLNSQSFLFRTNIEWKK